MRTATKRKNAAVHDEEKASKHPKGIDVEKKTPKKKKKEDDQEEKTRKDAIAAMSMATSYRPTTKYNVQDEKQLQSGLAEIRKGCGPVVFTLGLDQKQIDHLISQVSHISSPLASHNL